MSSRTSPAAGTRTETEQHSVRVGVDLGIRNLFTAAPVTDDPDVDVALAVDGTAERALFDELGATTRRLQALEVETANAEAWALCTYRAAFTERFALATAKLLEYLDDVDADVVALEDLAYDPIPLAECRRGEADVGAWLLPAFQPRLAAAIAATGCRVEYVAPDYTSKECHVCDVHGERGRDGTLRCVNDSCPVDAVCRDRSAAVSIAKRVDVDEQAGGMTYPDDLETPQKENPDR